MHEDEAPRQMRAPLQLAEAHLSEQDEEDAGRQPEQARRAVTTRGEIAEAEEERDQEDPDDSAVPVDDGLEPPEAIDVLGLAAARVRPCGRRERAADDQDETGRREREAEPAQLERDQRLDAAESRAAGAASRSASADRSRSRADRSAPAAT